MDLDTTPVIDHIGDGLIATLTAFDEIRYRVLDDDPPECFAYVRAFRAVIGQDDHVDDTTAFVYEVSDGCGDVVQSHYYGPDELDQFIEKLTEWRTILFGAK
jgi:hypothetical protein